jgi:hypothetical protein
MDYLNKLQRFYDTSRDQVGKELRDRLSIVSLSKDRIDLLHALIGLSASAGKVSSVLEGFLSSKTLNLDESQIIHELGNCLCYIVQSCSALHVSPEVLIACKIQRMDKASAIENTKQKYYSCHNCQSCKPPLSKERRSVGEVLAERMVDAACINSNHISDYARTEHREQTGAGWSEPTEDCDAKG